MSTPYYVVVDADASGDGYVNECVEDHNMASVNAVTCSGVYLGQARQGGSLHP